MSVSVIRGITCLTLMIAVLISPTKTVCANSVYADSLLTVKPNKVTAAFMIGYLAAHHSSMEAMLQRSLFGGELNLGYQTNGAKNWQSFYGYPEYGIAFLYYDLGSPDYLGKAVAVQPYMVFPILGQDNWGNLYFKMGVGVSYVTKTWNQYDNYKNTGIGSHFNASAKFEFGARFRLNSSWSATAGISLSHMSNGSTNNPNSGINMPSLNLGASYSFGRESSYIPYQPLKTSKKIQYLLFVSGSMKDIFPDGVGHYPVLTVSNFLYKPLKLHTGVGVSLDFMYDDSQWKQLQIAGDTVSKFKLIKSGLALDYTFKFDRVSLNFQFGHYLYTYYKADGLFYQRLALRYEFLPKAYFQVALRTDWFNADCIEFGLGYKFSKP